MFNILLGALVLSVVFNLLMFLVAYYYKTDKLTDISYSLSFILLALFAALYTGHLNYYSFILIAMVTLWALRLGSFLLYRVLKKGKDNRFNTIRTNFNKFLLFWMAQALTAWIVMIPAIMAINNYAKFDFVNIFLDILWNIGVLIWTAGLLIEAFSDLQKYTFRSNKKNSGKWIETGLWRYSRHPNYFGEILVWLGIYLSSFIVLSTSERIAGLLSPIFITIVLVYISGIPILEKNADKKWGTNKNYQAYKKRSNLLLPLPVKKLD